MKEHWTTLFLGSYMASTRGAYRGDLEKFAAHRRQPGIAALGDDLLALDQRSLQQAVEDYRSGLMELVAPATLNRRLSAIRSLMTYARKHGYVVTSVDVPGVPSEPYRDTAGPTLEEVQQVLRHFAAKEQTPKVIRDIAIFRLLCDNAFRRGEVSGLRHKDIEANGTTIHIGRKGSSERFPATLADITSIALCRWLNEHEGYDALFYSVDRRAYGHPLRGESIWNIIRRMGRNAGLDRDIWPHALRHFAITNALDLGCDVRQVQRFARLKSVNGICTYDDNREDLAGIVAKSVAAQLSAGNEIRSVDE